MQLCTEKEVITLSDAKEPKDAFGIERRLKDFMTKCEVNFEENGLLEDAD